ncbi:MAG: SNF2-related protein, partial [Opitutaceae bacterium]
MPRVEAATSNVGAMLRILLPPNLTAAAARNAVAVKVELGSGTDPAPELLPALAWLQRQTTTPARSPLFLQFTRAQLRELILLTEDQPVFFWVNRPTEPLAWRNGDLSEVSQHLEEPELPDPAPASPAETFRIARPRPAGSGTASPLVVDGSEHYLAFTLPAREHPTYDEALQLAKAHGFVLETSNRRWWLRDRHKTLNFLATYWTDLHEHFGAQFTANFIQNTARLQLAGVICAAAAGPDGYDVTLALQTGRASEESVRAAMSGGRGYVEASDGIVLLPAATMDRLAEVRRRLSGDATGGAGPRQTLHITGAGVVEAGILLESLAPNFQPPAEWRARSEALRNLSKLLPAPLPPALAGQLRPYQQIGTAWLWHLYRHELGGILADEMGLGKTLQALALLTVLHGEKSQNPRLKPQTGNPSLVVCPASLVENWRREAARFTPELRTVAHHGGARADAADAFSAADLVITSYGTLVRDRELFASVEFACAIGDEAQHIKNRRTQNAQTLRGLRARGRFLLTGTPLENSLDDLHSLFDFLMPGYLAAPPAGTRGDDRAWHDERLLAQTGPYILRRTKAVVAPELPPKIEQIIYCELPSAQAALYRAWQERGERELDSLAAGGASDARLRLATLTQLLRLRQICCDPRLVEAVEPPSLAVGRGSPPSPSLRSAGPTPPLPNETTASGLRSTASAASGDAAPHRSEPTSPPVDSPSNPAAVPGIASAKLEAFRELLEEAVDDGHRLLVFSQFTSL